ncbi:NAD-dependent epimerase/dehydratase family protein [Asticcacaulis sp. EMRT-3]|uniref:NAD-dependent epimerase/dehydratase family protein n=1 Tax=Asticcacaulis sp. EMRT-3 TaxID=3040349 RepID=UPI0024AF8A19|nr:NAD-dependent epimerase/dehydratase family protein [Asticcacaulis sp. EMRT-3]MDI7774075.1 NAD-dependent epimerase/dehydratase family protein [Asticcacaulis sp. EMRT-3]
MIGARSLVGRRMHDALIKAGWPQEAIWRTARKPIAGQGLVLDATRPEAFQPDNRFSHVIICAPVWLVSEALLQRLQALGMQRLVAFSSTSRLTKGESLEPAEREVVEKLAAGEARVAQFCAQNSIDWTILRPTLIYDEGHDENVTRIADLIRKLGFFPLCGKASGLRQPVHARDLAAAAAAALPAEASFGKSYNLPGGESLTYHDMVARVFAALGRRPLILSLPEVVWRWGFAVLDVLTPGRKLKRNLQMVVRMNRDLWFDPVPPARDFGYAPGDFKPDFKADSRG